jgi:ferritin
MDKGVVKLLECLVKEQEETNALLARIHEKLMRLSASTAQSDAVLHQPERRP